MWWQNLHPFVVGLIVVGTVPAILLIAMLVKGEW